MQKQRVIHFCLSGIFFLLASIGSFAQVKIGNNPTTLTPSAILEMETTNRGMLLPRLSLSATDNAAMGGSTNNAVQGMTVYNINASIGGTLLYPANGIGIYTFDGTGWVYGGIPTGGTAGQVLSKTATGLSWGSPASGVTAYLAGGSSTTAAGAFIKATGSGVAFSVSTASQTATITVPAGVELLSVRLFDEAATGALTSYGLDNTNNTLKINIVYTGRTISYSSTSLPQLQVLLNGTPAVYMDTYGAGYPRQYELIWGTTNNYTVNIPLMNPQTLGNKWTVLLNF